MAFIGLVRVRSFVALYSGPISLEAVCAFVFVHTGKLGNRGGAGESFQEKIGAFKGGEYVLCVLMY